MSLLRRDAAILVVIDLQKRLLAEIPEADAAVARAVTLIGAATDLDIPVVCTEQYPKGLGPTVDAVTSILPCEITEKLSFGCFGHASFPDTLGTHPRRRQLVLMGAETHVCVLQTALGALERGYEAFVVVDAVASRQGAQHRAGLERMADAGVGRVTAEMVVFEWLGRAGTPEFKQLLPLIKELG